MLSEEQKILNRARNFAGHYASMIGHDNADNLMALADLAEKQQIEIRKMKEMQQNPNVFHSLEEHAKTQQENNRLLMFKEATEETVGPVILDFILSRQSSK